MTSEVDNQFVFLFLTVHILLIATIPKVCVPTFPSLVAQMVKRLSTMRKTWVRSLGREDSLEKEMATHSSTLA